MEEKTKTFINNKSSRREIILMAILIPLIFCVTFGISFFLVIFICDEWTWFWDSTGIFIILSFCIGWIYVVHLLLKKYTKGKILFVVAGLGVSISALTVWVLDKLNLGHMFG